MNGAMAHHLQISRRRRAHESNTALTSARPPCLEGDQDQR